MNVVHLFILAAKNTKIEFKQFLCFIIKDNF